MKYPTLFLCSQSPRRRELLAGLNIPYEVVSVDADETYPQHLSGGDIPIYISRAKAKAYLEQHPTQDGLLMTADTIVWLDGQVMGKPKDEKEACHMLRLLSGKTHHVYTGVTLTPMGTFAQGREQVSFCDATDVSFRVLTDEEIQEYVTRYRPYDKAGAYGIQEWIGYIGVTGINGSYFNVMGLPVERLYHYLSLYIDS